MRVICTGISGTERVGFLQAVAERARQAGRELKILDVRDVMFQIAEDVGEPVEEETILDMFPRALVLLRAAALEKIAGLVEQGGRDQDWVINTHAVFRWRNTLVSGFDPYYLRRLRPDLYITVTPGVLTVRERLRQFPRWEEISIEELLVWREEEQWATEEMARIHHKPQLLWPRSMTPNALHRVMFTPKQKTAYLSYPMQHAEQGVERRLAGFKRRLDERLVIYDPADVNDFAVEVRRANDGTARAGAFSSGAPSDGSVELTRALAGAAPRAEALVAEDHDVAKGQRGPLADQVDGSRAPAASAFTERELQHIADQIVFRDYKLIAQSDMVIVYYDALVPSPGVISEMNYALQTGKRVYGVWLPESEPSPFFTRYCTRCFHAEDELFRYFERYRIAGGRKVAAGG